MLGRALQVLTIVVMVGKHENENIWEILPLDTFLTLIYFSGKKLGLKSLSLVNVNQVFHILLLQLVCGAAYFPNCTCCYLQYSQSWCERCIKCYQMSELWPPCRAYSGVIIIKVSTCDVYMWGLLFNLTSIYLSMRAIVMYEGLVLEMDGTVPA